MSKHRTHCLFKKHSGGKACNCGVYGQKVKEVPYGYEGNERMESKARTWKKKEAIRKLRVVKKNEMH